MNWFVKFCIIAALFSGCKGADKQGLVVGTNSEYPPYSFIQEGQIAGFDIDVAKEVAKRMGQEVVFRNLPFDGLIAELKMNRVDFLAAGLTKTEERAKNVLFTKAYLSGDPLIIVSKSPIHSLKGKKVIVNEGYTADTYATSLGGMEILRLPTPADALWALEKGKGDAYITAKSTVDDYLKGHPEAKLSFADTGAASDGVSIAVSLDHPELLEKIQMVLNEMEMDGTLHSLQKKWGL